MDGVRHLMSSTFQTRLRTEQDRCEAEARARWRGAVADVRDKARAQIAANDEGYARHIRQLVRSSAPTLRRGQQELKQLRDETASTPGSRRSRRRCSRACTRTPQRRRQQRAARDARERLDRRDRLATLRGA